MITISSEHFAQMWKKLNGVTERSVMAHQEQKRRGTIEPIRDTIKSTVTATGIEKLLK